MFYVYILECADGTLYTGYTNNLDKRVFEHNSAKTGAKYTKIRRPVKLKYYESFNIKGESLKREHQIKKLKRVDKLELVNNFTKNTDNK